MPNLPPVWSCELAGPQGVPQDSASAAAQCFPQLHTIYTIFTNTVLTFVKMYRRVLSVVLRFCATVSVHCCDKMRSADSVLENADSAL